MPFSCVLGQCIYPLIVFGFATLQNIIDGSYWLYPEKKEYSEIEILILNGSLHLLLIPELIHFQIWWFRLQKKFYFLHFELNRKPIQILYSDFSSFYCSHNSIASSCTVYEMGTDIGCTFNAFLGFCLGYCSRRRSKYSLTPDEAMFKAMEFSIKLQFPVSSWLSELRVLQPTTSKHQSAYT